MKRVAGALGIGGALVLTTPCLMGSGCGSCEAEIRNISVSPEARCVDFSVPYTNRGGSCEAALAGVNRCDGDLVFSAVGGRPAETYAPGAKFNWLADACAASARERCVVNATLKGQPVQFAFDITFSD